MFYDSATKTSARDRFFDSLGVRLRFTVQGEGIPVVLLHGFLGDIETSWIGSPYGPQPNLLPRLAEHFQVIGLDCRGHGKSDKPQGSRQYGAALADDVVRLLDHRNLEKAHLIGYSLGALVAGKVLACFPSRLHRVVLGGSALYARSLFPQGKAPEDDVIAAELEKGQGIVSYILASAPEGQPKPTREQAEAISQFVLADKNVPALAALARGMIGLGVSDEELLANRVPTLAIIGTQDEGMERVRQLQTRMSQLQIREIEGADHISTLTNPAFYTTVREFLKAGTLT